MLRKTTLTMLAVVALIAAIAAGTAAAFGFDDTKPPPNGQVGVPYSFKFEAPVGSGTPPLRCQLMSGAIPTGLRISDECVLSGTPTAAGTFSFWLQLQDSLCVANPTGCLRSESSFTIRISSRLVVTTNSLPDGALNQPYPAQQLTVSGGTASSWAVVAGSPPPGIAVSSSGLVSGTPTQPGPFTFTVQANGSPNNDTKQLTIFVLAPLEVRLAGGAVPTKTPVPLNGKVNSPFTWDVDAFGGKAPYTFSSTPLPAGLTLDPATGTVSGTPTGAGLTRITMTVADQIGGTASLQAVLFVKPLLAFVPTAKAKPKVGRVGKRYAWRVRVVGASATKLFVASGNYPPGLSLDEATGIVSGTPLVDGRFKMKVWVLGDPGTQITKTFVIRIKK
jgi:hypothetical protein